MDITAADRRPSDFNNDVVVVDDLGLVRFD